jgi:hypothetical protein
MGLPLSAAYVDESPSNFLLNVKRGRWPAGRRDHGRRVYWFKDELDKALALARGKMEAIGPDDVDWLIDLGPDDDQPAA